MADAVRALELVPEEDAELAADGRSAGLVEADTLSEAVTDRLPVLELLGLAGELDAVGAAGLVVLVGVCSWVLVRDGESV